MNNCKKTLINISTCVIFVLCLILGVFFFILPNTAYADKNPNEITNLVLEGWTYGDPKVPTATATYGEISYTYSTEENGVYTETIPENAGTYWVKAEVAETEEYYGAIAKKSFIIAKADMINGYNILAPTIPTTTLVFDGTNLALLAEGLTIDEITGEPFGTFYYFRDNTQIPKTTLPTAKDPGEYYPMWYFKGDSNHNDIGSVEHPILQLEPVVIESIDQIIAQVIMAGYTYGDIVSVPSLDEELLDSPAITYYYSTNNSNEDGIKWANINPTSLSAGTYYMYAQIGATTSYSGYTTEPQSFTVGKREIKIIWSNNNTLAYTGKDLSNQISVKYRLLDGIDHPIDSQYIQIKNKKEVIGGTSPSYVVKDFTDVGEYVANLTTAGWRVVLNEAGSNYKLPMSGARTHEYSIVKIEAEPLYNEIKNLSLEGWRYGDTPNTPSATATFGDIVYSYSTEENGVYTSNVPTSVGKYFVKAEAKVPGFTKAVAITSFEIKKAQVVKPIENVTVFEYTGSPITYTIVDSEHYTVSGNTQTEVGTHNVTVSLKDKNNYEWSDGSINDVILSFVIIENNNEDVTSNVGIVIGIIILLLLLIYLYGYFIKYRKGKLDEKKIRVIYKFLPRGNKE